MNYRKNSISVVVLILLLMSGCTQDSETSVSEENSVPIVVNSSLNIEQDSYDNEIILNASDADGDRLTYKVIEFPLHGVLKGTAPNLTYTPEANYKGVDSFTFKVNDGSVDSDIGIVTINIEATFIEPTFYIKKTGQIESYNRNGEEVQDNSLKDDGYYQKGVAPSYTRASDIVTDELRNLMWQDNADVSTVKKEWLSSTNYSLCEEDASSTACYDTGGDTVENYCKTLSLGGYTDWRVPSITELGDIVDYFKSSPKIDTNYFNSIETYFYWSSSTYEDEKKSAAWLVDFNNAYIGDGNKNAKYFVRCVRDKKE